MSVLISEEVVTHSSFLPDVPNRCFNKSMTVGRLSVSLFMVVFSISLTTIPWNPRLRIETGL